MQGVPIKITAIAVSLLTVILSPARAKSPTIDEIQWWRINSYCTFMRNGQEFVFEDPDTWRFVFFTDRPERGLDLMGRAFMRIDGQLRELALQSVTANGGSWQRRYHTHDDVPYVIEVAAAPVNKGQEHTSYTGAITVSRDGMTSSVDFAGDCGV